MSERMAFQLWPGLPLELRLWLYAYLGRWGMRHCTPWLGVDVFVYELLRQGLSLRALRDLLWRELAEEYQSHDPYFEFPWPPPAPEPAPDAHAEMQRVIVNAAAELPPELAYLPKMIFESIAHAQFGDDLPPAASFEWLCSTGFTPENVEGIVLMEIDRLARWYRERLAVEGREAVAHWPDLTPLLAAEGDADGR